jgi:hypothetical protein
MLELFKKHKEIVEKQEQVYKLNREIFDLSNSSTFVNNLQNIVKKLKDLYSKLIINHGRSDINLFIIGIGIEYPLYTGDYDYTSFSNIDLENDQIILSDFDHYNNIEYDLCDFNPYLLFLIYMSLYDSKFNIEEKMKYMRRLNINKDEKI